MCSLLLTLLLVLLPITVTVKGDDNIDTTQDFSQTLPNWDVLPIIDDKIWSAGPQPIKFEAGIPETCYYRIWWDTADGTMQGEKYAEECFRMVEVVDTVGWKIHLYNAMQNHDIAPDTMYFSDSVSQTYFCDSYVLIPILKKCYLFISPTGDTVRCNCGGEL